MQHEGYEKEGVFIIIRTQKEMLPAGSFCCLLEKVIFLLEKNLDNE